MKSKQHPEYLGIGALYSIFWTLMLVLIMLCSWLMMSTTMLLRPVAISYEGPNFTMVRQTPHGEVWGRWSTEIRAINIGLECSSGRHFSLYQEVHTDEELGTVADTVNLRLGDWAQPCLDAGLPLIIVDTWQAYLFGVIPLRPVTKTTIVREIPIAP